MNKLSLFMNRELKKISPKGYDFNDFLGKCHLAHFIIGDHKVLGKCKFTHFGYLLAPNFKEAFRLLNTYIEKVKLYKGCQVVVLKKGRDKELPPWKNKDGYERYLTARLTHDRISMRLTKYEYNRRVGELKRLLSYGPKSYKDHLFFRLLNL